MPVFISHSLKDKPAVEALAMALRERGIEVWLDKWEIGPGDDIVASINAGLDEAGCGIIVFSKESWESLWVRAQASYLQYARIEEGKALIPVIVGPDELWLPPLLRPLARRGIEEVDAIADAVLGRKVRPVEQGRTERLLVTPCASVADETFDVFLSHAHQNAELVELLAEKLEDEENLSVWLDRWILIPGEHWQQAMARGLEYANTCVVCIGVQTPQGWFQEEIQRALNRQTKEKTFRVIPVILPGGDRACVDDFLELRTWVDFKDGIDDPRALHDLVSGIRGVPPKRFRRERATKDAEAVEIRTKLQFIRDLGDVIDKEVRIEYQKLLLDGIIKRERLK